MKAAQCSQQTWQPGVSIRKMENGGEEARDKLRGSKKEVQGAVGWHLKGETCAGSQSTKRRRQSCQRQPPSGRPVASTD